MPPLLVWSDGVSSSGGMGIVRLDFLFLADRRQKVVDPPESSLGGGARKVLPTIHPEDPKQAKIQNLASIRGRMIKKRALSATEPFKESSAISCRKTGKLPSLRFFH
jgi:hypothetical protein